MRFWNNDVLTTSSVGY
ncbi:hypothetical protein [Legionella anisa]|nr:hypothetical protein [Legionella anisa]